MTTTVAVRGVVGESTVVLALNHCWYGNRGQGCIRRLMACRAWACGRGLSIFCVTQIQSCLPAHLERTEDSLLQ